MLAGIGEDYVIEEGDADEFARTLRCGGARPVSS
jgi:hypothetical protein